MTRHVTLIPVMSVLDKTIQTFSDSGFDTLFPLLVFVNDRSQFSINWKPDSHENIS